jgi:CO dehydrogenase/acetyl-CoA synthase gamma subunit (corrinoid Fe-S protein)
VWKTYGFSVKLLNCSTIVVPFDSKILKNKGFFANTVYLLEVWQAVYVGSGEERVSVSGDEVAYQRGVGRFGDGSGRFFYSGQKAESE